MLDRRQVYLDNSAVTRLDERVLEAMKPYFFDKYAVATSEFAYSQGIEVPISWLACWMETRMVSFVMESLSLSRFTKPSLSTSR